MRGRSIKAPAGLITRPTASLVREALFQILTFRLEQAWEETTVLDLFAGSGTLGIEALSRGANHVTFVEKNRTVAGVLRQNLHACGVEEKADVVLAELGGAVTSSQRFLYQHLKQVHLILADPPYNTHLSKWILQWILEGQLLLSGGILVVEESKAAKLPDVCDGHCKESESHSELRLFECRCYGHTSLWFYLMERNR